jgi:hypothetical protein
LWQSAAVRAVRLTQVCRKTLLPVARAVAVVLTQVLTQALPQRELQDKATPVQQVQPRATYTVVVVVARGQQDQAPMAARAFLAR